MTENGFIEGAQAGQQYSQSEQLFQLTKASDQQKLQEGAQQIQLNQFKIQEAPLSVKEKEIAVKTAQRALDFQDSLRKQMQARTQGGGQGPTDQVQDLADTLMFTSQAEAMDGRPDAAAATAAKAGTLLKNNAEIVKYQQESQHKMFTDVSNVLSGAQESSQGWEQAKALFVSLHPDEAKQPDVQKILQMPYSPGMVGRVRDSVIGLKDKAEIAKNNAQAVNAYSDAKLHDFQRTVAVPEKLRLEAATEARRAKAGANDLNPKPADINAIVDKAKRDFKANVDMTDPSVLADLRDRSRAVAATAKHYEVVDGMPRAAAQDRAYQEARDSQHVYAGLKNKGIGDIGSSEKNPFPTLKPPKDLPANQTVDWYMKNLKDGKFYVTNSTDLPGGIGKWNAQTKSFEAASTGEGTGTAADVDDQEDDE